MRQFFTILFIGSLVAISCKEKTNKTNVESYDVVMPLKTSYIINKEYVSEIHSVKYVEVRSRIKGYIEKIHIDEGQTVQEGQLLFTLNSIEFEKELQKAVAAYKNAKADLKAAEVEQNNISLLVQKKIISKTELEAVKSKIEALKADVEEAEAHKEQANHFLSYTQIRAPFNGTINRIPKKAGSLIEEGGTLTTISNNKEIFAYFNLSESDYLNYINNKEKESNIVQLKLANNEMYSQSGKIEVIESEFDQATGNIAFRARFSNQDGLLKHGSNGKILMKKTVKDALLIPQKSTFEIQDKLYVYVVGNDSTLTQRAIVPKNQYSNFFEIASGLNPNEQIVYEGVENLRNGLKISPKSIDAQKVLQINN